jgi:hypothetical protein
MPGEPARAVARVASPGGCPGAGADAGAAAAISLVIVPGEASSSTTAGLFPGMVARSLKSMGLGRRSELT